MSVKTKCVEICTHCNSDNVQIKAWVKPNQNNEFVDLTEDSIGWCEDCQDNVHIEGADLKADAKVVGFQVVGEDGCEEAGHMHPDMDASFCLYSLSQARNMLKKDRKWRLLAIWTGDIEEPTMMFDSDPRS